jgi:GDP-L-fucose synthase
MKVFVTGGSGFLGRHLIPKLKALGYEVVAPNSKQCDLTRQDALAAFNTHKYEKIFHLAAWTQAGDFCLKHPGDQWIINQQINTNLLAWWHQSQPQAKLIAIGTSCAYPEEGPLVEERYMEGEPTPSLYTYAMTKRMLYQGMRALSTQYGLQWLCVVPSTLYGLGYETDGKQLHFIYDLNRKIKNAARGGDPPVLWGDGYQRREVIHVDDFICDLCGLLAKNFDGLFNIGAGADHSIREFAEMISAIAGYSSQLILYDTSKYVGAKSKKLSVAKLFSHGGGKERMPLLEGLIQIYTSDQNLV